MDIYHPIFLEITKPTCSLLALNHYRPQLGAQTFNKGQPSIGNYAITIAGFLPPTTTQP